MISKAKIIEKCLELDDEDFSRQDYTNAINYFYDKDKNLSELIIDKNLRMNSFLMTVNSIEKRVQKIKKSHNLIKELKLADYLVNRILNIIIQAVFNINHAHFNENITEEKFIEILKKDKDEKIVDVFKKIGFNKLKRIYDSGKFDTEVKMNFYSRDLAIDLKFAKSWDREKLNEYSKLIYKIMQLYSNLHKDSGRHEFKILENKSIVLSFKDFVNNK